MDAGLGCRVVGLAELAALAVDRRDVDDAAPAALDHRVDYLLGGVEQAVEVGGNHRAPVLGSHLLERGIAGDTGVVDQHVDLADILAHLGEGAHGVIPVGDVAGQAVKFETVLLLLLQPGILARGLRAATNHHDEAVTVKAPADRRADATHATSYQSNTFVFVGHAAVTPLDN
ncbi:hypothetical protein D3C78_865790 [compost metagenome]